LDYVEPEFIPRREVNSEVKSGGVFGGKGVRIN
jgi:hypothetical protein